MAGGEEEMGTAGDGVPALGLPQVLPSSFQIKKFLMARVAAEIQD